MKPARPWREVLKVHPAAEMFPLMTSGELHELAEDIKKNGLIDKISYIKQDGEFIVLDGWNRLDALTRLGKLYLTPSSDGRLDPVSFTLNPNTDEPCARCGGSGYEPAK